MKLKDKIIKVIEGVNVGAVATLGSITYPVPKVRYMTVFGYPDMTLMAATRKSSPKISQIKDIPKACITIWKGKGLEEAFTKPHVIIDADVEILDDEKTKKEFWKPEFEAVFSGANDPEYVVLRFKPYSIEYCEGDKVEKWTSCRMD